MKKKVETKACKIVAVLLIIALAAPWIIIATVYLKPSPIVVAGQCYLGGSDGSFYKVLKVGVTGSVIITYENNVPKLGVVLNEHLLNINKAVLIDCFILFTDKASKELIAKVIDK